LEQYIVLYEILDKLNYSIKKLKLLWKNILLYYILKQMPLHTIVERFLVHSLNENREQFVNNNGQLDLQALGKSENKAALLSFVLVYIVVFVLLMFVGKWLWNGWIVDMVTVAKPVESVISIIALAVFVKLVIY
jgi:hypothetical protein